MCSVDRIEVSELFFLGESWGVCFGGSDPTSSSPRATVNLIILESPSTISSAPSSQKSILDGVSVISLQITLLEHKADALFWPRNTKLNKLPSRPTLVLRQAKTDRSHTQHTGRHRAGSTSDSHPPLCVPPPSHRYRSRGPDKKSQRNKERYPRHFARKTLFV